MYASLDELQIWATFCFQIRYLQYWPMQYAQTFSWWRHQMETFTALLALCAENSPVTGEFPAQRPVTRSVDVFFDLRLNKRLSKQSWGWWFETSSRPLWRQFNVLSLLESVMFYSCPVLHHWHRNTRTIAQVPMKWSWSWSTVKSLI